MTIETFERKLHDMGFCKGNYVPFTRNSTFTNEPCEICGSTILIQGIGRYIIFDDSTPIEIFLCGKCESEIEEKYKLDFM